MTVGKALLTPRFSPWKTRWLVALWTEMGKLGKNIHSNEDEWGKYYFLILDYSPDLIYLWLCNNFNVMSRLEFPNLSTVDILDQIILCWGWGELSWALWMFSSILDFYQLHASSTDSLFVTTKTISRHCQMTRGGGVNGVQWVKIAPLEYLV